MFEIAAIKRRDGTSLHYTDDGSGLPLVFLHGWMMSHRVWTLQQNLSDRFRIITLDLRGHGHDTGADFSYNACCEDIVLLLDRLGLKRVVIIGWSMGAQIAIKVFPAVDGRVAAMVLVGGTPHFCRSNDFLDGVPPAEARSMALRLKKDYTRTAGEFFSSMFSPEEAVAVDMRALAGSVIGRLPAREITLSALHELTSSDLRDDLKRITTPVMLVHGGDDKICPCGAAEFMAGRIPSAVLELIPAAGHAPFLANPEAFNRMLAGFLQAVHG